MNCEKSKNKYREYWKNLCNGDGSLKTSDSLEIINHSNKDIHKGIAKLIYTQALPFNFIAYKAYKDLIEMIKPGVNIGYPKLYRKKNA